MKFDLPDPLAPMTTFIAPSFSFSMEAILLNPLTVIQSSSGITKLVVGTAICNSLVI